jgi:hypothetical protein
MKLLQQAKKGFDVNRLLGGLRWPQVVCWRVVACINQCIGWCTCNAMNATLQRGRSSLT